MKKLIFFLLIILPFLTFSQDAITYKGNGRILNANNQKLTSKDVRSLMESNQFALKLYNSGKTKQTLGNILLYGGISTVVAKHIFEVKRDRTKSDGSVDYSNNENVLYYVGAGMIFVAIPIKIGFSKKIKRAVNLINENLRNPTTGFSIDSSTFIVNSNGVGVSITF